MTTGSPAVAPGGALRLDTSRGRAALLATVLASGMTMLDGTVVNLALPRMGEELDADFAGLQWVVNGYTLTLASFILLGGSLGDRLGRRRVFLVGVVWFTIASLSCALAPTVEVLVVARVAQGLGGALLVPGSLSILQASFDPADRGRAIGAWSGLGGITVALGPLVGGWLVDAASWRWIFLLNLPLGLLVVVVGRAHLPETRDLDASGRTDVVGAVLGAGGLAGVTWALIEHQVAIGVLGVVLLAGFVVSQARQRDPMMPLSIFRSRQLSAANGVTFVLYGVLGAALFLLGLTLQVSLGYSPLEAGLATVPITAVMLAFSARAGALANRIGPRVPMALGPVGMAGGLALMATIEPGRTYATGILPALLVFSAGLALTVAPLTATALAAAEDRHAGLASGVNNAVARTGQLLAVAAIPLVAGFAPGEPVGAAVLLDGFHRVVLASAGGALLAAAVAWTSISSDVLGPASATAPPDGALRGADRPPGAEHRLPHRECEPVYQCAVDGPPLVTDTGAARRA